MSEKKTRLVYSVPEAAEMLGCSDDHVYRLISKGALRRVDIKVGTRSKTRILHDDLVAFLNSRKVA